MIRDVMSVVLHGQLRNRREDPSSTRVTRSQRCIVFHIAAAADPIRSEFFLLFFMDRLLVPFSHKLAIPVT